MSIKSYVPLTKKIIDHRSPEGGYYTANCDICGTEFFPARRNAKYCSPNCGVVSHRIAFANGTLIKKIPKSTDSNPVTLPKELIIVGVKNVLDYLERRFDTNREKGKIIMFIKNLKIGQQGRYKTCSIKRISPSRYRVTKI